MPTNARSLSLAIALALLPGTILAASVSGRLTDASGDIPFAGAEVRILGLERRVVSDRDGRFRLADLPPGTYTLQIDYLGADRLSRSVTVTDADLELGTVLLGADVTLLENILVIGQIAGQAAALNQQRASDTIVNVVSADAIGQFPDQNVAESLARVPGISLARDQGEGRFAVIRGIDPSLNTTTINGVRVPGPEDDSRQVNLDVISSDLLETLEVTKSVTPDMDGDAIGGNIEIKSLSAFDRGGRSISGRVEGSYNELRSEISPKTALTYTDLFSLGSDEENFGVAFSVSHFRRRLGSDGIETAGFPLLEAPDGSEIAGLEEAEQRDYTLTRERTSASLNFDWLAGDSTDLYWRNLYSRFEDDEVQLTNVFKFEDGDIESLSDSAGVFSGATVEKLTEARVETQEIFATSLGGSSRLDDWTLDYSASYAFANEDKPGALGGLWVSEGVDIGYRLNDRRRPRLLGFDGALTDASAYALDEAELEDAFTEETETAFAVDVQRDVDWGSRPGFIKFGGKARLRDKEGDIDLTVYEGFGDDFSLADFDFARTEFPFGELGPFASRRSFAEFFRNRSNFEIDEESTLIENAGSDYRLDEDIYAAYAMARVEFDTFSLIGGLRYEDTRYSAVGTQVLIDEENSDGDAQISPLRAEKDYDVWLPGLHLRWEASENLVVRAAVNRTIGRPSFEASAPRQLIEIEEDDGEFERKAEIGNPDLDPLRSNNVDLMLEYYPGGIGLLSAGVFYKDIKDFVVFVDVAGSGAFADFDEVIQPVNGSSARLHGLELAWVQQLEFLPGIWDGLLITANYTLVDSEARVPFRDSKIPLPLQSDQVGNFAVGYEKYGLSLRLATTWRSAYFEEVNDPEDPSFDRYADDHLQVDFTGKYRLNPNLQLYLNAINLNDEPFYAYFGGPRFASQFEQYGRTYELGMQFNF